VWTAATQPANDSSLQMLKMDQHMHEKKILLLAPAVTLPLLYPILRVSISRYGTPAFPMISKIHPSMPAQTMFDIILTSLCSLPATHWGIYPLGLILFLVPGEALQLRSIWWIC